jgi:2'-5' RNA ligase
MRVFIGTITTVRGVWQIKEKVFSYGVEGKWVEKHNLHFTYRFLGELTDSVVSEIAESLKNSLKEVEAPEIVYKGLGVFNNRVLWVGMESEGIFKVKKRIDSILAEFGFEEEKRFTPHLTLLRIKRLRDPHGFKRFVKSMENYVFERKKEKFVHFVESTLTRKGPIYRVIEKYELR